MATLSQLWWYGHSMRWVHTALLGVVVMELAFAILIAKNTNVTWPLTRIIGSCLLVIVMAWVVAARIQLGRSFSISPQARKLVTTGIYARIRNPIYVASPFFPIGLALVIGKWWPLLLSVIIIPVQLIRARREAAVLHAAFGDEYDRYRARTWF